MSSLTNTEQLLHRQAIVDTLGQHSRGLDRGDPELIKSAYWPEATVDYGAFKGDAHQFAELIGPALASAYELTQHLLGQSLVDINGANARSETYVQARHLLLGATEELNFVGRYLDSFECREGEWKMMHRQVVMDWSLNSAVTDARNSEAFAALSKGKNTGDDPSYPFFGDQ